MGIVNVSGDRYNHRKKKKCTSINLVELIKENNVRRKECICFNNISNPQNKFVKSGSKQTIFDIYI